ncbi:MAG: type II toxin-antitoxin system VapC family toxin [Nanoarchaeota archaeon]|nr:type II toxin-antitoxin system VapC family toxin [Nanoarchaeota archaeon]MBU1270472.1 type II toxin-antitoxin system VapC family toxin [Nanoarchaeota archaeon]MBU2443720.1 type II toxin-antitoxin system VapC family toxin [Nanoarchaeota archaeon]
MKIYFDTNVYIDFLENRADKFRPLGELAFQSFQRGINCEFHIVISELVVKELSKSGVSKEKIKKLINWFGEKIILVENLKNDFSEAKKAMKKYKIHFEDALHYQTSKRIADKLLTNDNDLKLLP